MRGRISQAFIYFGKAEYLRSAKIGPMTERLPFSNQPNNGGNLVCADQL